MLELALIRHDGKKESGRGLPSLRNTRTLKEE